MIYTIAALVYVGVQIAAAVGQMQSASVLSPSEVVTFATLFVTGLDLVLAAYLFIVQMPSLAVGLGIGAATCLASGNWLSLFRHNASRFYCCQRFATLYTAAAVTGSNQGRALDPPLTRSCSRIVFKQRGGHPPFAI